MKGSVIILLVLGVLAAICAAVLVAVLGVGRTMGRGGGDAAGQEPMSTVLVAARAMTPMEVVDQTSLTATSIPRSKLTPGTFSNPAEIIGKALAVPMLEGQAFGRACFADEGTRTKLASSVPAGKRAVGVTLTEHAGLDGVLYPGCIVDVLVSFKGSENVEPFSVTLLSAVEVLAIERATIIPADPAKKEELEIGASRQNSGRRVTLLVDLKQAKALQVAMDHGVISLALRNPRDVARANTDTVALSQVTGQTGLIVRDLFNDVMAGLVMAARSRGDQVAAAPPPPIAPATQPSPPAPAAPAAAPKPSQWETIVIRGTGVETRLFEMPLETEAAAPRRN